jgi:hypothetical protein
MLFDVRSGRRRHAVRIIYLGLALIMLSGLVLLGVGTGNNNGGLLNAFTGNGSNSGQNSAINNQTKAAEKQVKANPNSAAAWANLIQAQYSVANQEQNATTGAFTTAGKQELSTSWTHYSALTKTPSPTMAILAARAYANLGNYASAANAWQDVAIAQPSEAKGYECWAENAMAAKETRTAGLAESKAVALVPKLEKLTVKEEITAAKTTPSVAADC